MTPWQQGCTQCGEQSGKRVIISFKKHLAQLITESEMCSSEIKHTHIKKKKTLIRAADWKNDLEGSM